MMRMWIVLGLGLMAGWGDETTNKPGTDAPVPDTVEPSNTSPVDTVEAGP